jgi:hypothetical protein
MALEIIWDYQNDTEATSDDKGSVFHDKEKK